MSTYVDENENVDDENRKENKHDGNVKEYPLSRRNHEPTPRPNTSEHVLKKWNRGSDKRNTPRGELKCRDVFHGISLLDDQSIQINGNVPVFEREARVKYTQYLSVHLSVRVRE